MIPLHLLSEIPAALSSSIAPAALPALAAATVAAPAHSGDWKSVANAVENAWSDGGSGAASRSLHRAAFAATELEGRASSIGATLKEGAEAISRAIHDLAQIIAEFVTSAVRSMSSLAAGPSGIATAGVALAAAASEALGRAQARLEALMHELEPAAARLHQFASSPVELPPLPAAATEAASAGSTGPGEHGAEELVGAGSAGDAAPTPQARAAVDNAMSALGTPYAWGGNTPGQGLDCSGLTHWAYGQAGVDIPRVAEDQAIGRPVSQSELLPGDLAVWDGHVAMVVGDGQMIEAGDPVQINPVRTTNIGMPFKGFYRPTG
nr:C40 family peptidase [Corynebacterium lactis]